LKAVSASPGNNHKEGQEDQAKGLRVEFPRKIQENPRKSHGKYRKLPETSQKISRIPENQKKKSKKHPRKFLESQKSKQKLPEIA